MLRGAWVAFAIVWSVCSAASAQSAAASWEATFTSTALAPLVQAGATRVLVVAAGAQHAQAREAATAIEAALTAAGAQLVMTDEGLGAVDTLDDAAIVGRSAVLPIGHVLIVRVFGTSDTEPNAVITLYAKDGALVRSLSGTRGKADVVTATAASPSVSSQAAAPQASSTTTVTPTATVTPSADAQRQYDEQHIGFVEGPTRHDRRYEDYADAYRGKFREPLSGEALYLALEQPELAERYRKSAGTQSLLLWGGLGLVGVGALVGSLSLSAAESCGGASDDACRGRYMPGVAVGFLSMVVGGVLMLVGAYTNVHPVDATELRRLADEHNQRLRQRLGLPPHAEPVIPQAPRAKWSWQLHASASTAGLTLQLDL